MLNIFYLFVHWVSKAVFHFSACPYYSITYPINKGKNKGIVLFSLALLTSLIEQIVVIINMKLIGPMKQEDSLCLPICLASYHLLSASTSLLHRGLANEKKKCVFPFPPFTILFNTLLYLVLILLTILALRAQWL